MRIDKFALAAGVAAISCLVPMAAEASATMAYLGLRGSYVMADDANATSFFIDDTRHFEDGWGATAYLGFVLSDEFRIEVEGGYRTNDIKEALIIRNDLDITTEGLIVPANGHVDMGIAMVNLYYDIHIDGLGFLPWVGAGAGGANVNYEIFYDYGDPVSPTMAKDTDWQFAYQLMAGATLPVSEGMSVTAGYRYFETEDMVFVDIYGDEFKTELTNHSIDVGVQWHL